MRKKSTSIPLLWLVLWVGLAGYLPGCKFQRDFEQEDQVLPHTPADPVVTDRQP